jgi:hypothetical protein
VWMSEVLVVMRKMIVNDIRVRVGEDRKKGAAYCRAIPMNEFWKPMFPRRPLQQLQQQQQLRNQQQQQDAGLVASGVPIPLQIPDVIPSVLYPANTSSTSSASYVCPDIEMGESEEEIRKKVEERERLNEEAEKKKRREFEEMKAVALEIANKKYQTNTSAPTSTPYAGVDIIVLEKKTSRADAIDEIEDFTSEEDGEEQVLSEVVKLGVEEEKRRAEGGWKKARGRKKKAKCILTEDEDCNMEH